METVLLLLLIANLAGLFLIWQRQDKQDKYLAKSLENQADNLSDQLDYRFEQARQASQLDQKDLEVAVSDRLQEVRMELHQGLTQVRQEMTDNLLQTRDKTDQRLQALQESNEQRLEQMRQTVEEKLERPYRRACRLPSRQFPNNWSLSIVVLERCRQLPAMLVLLTRFSLGLRREGFWENCNWGKSSKTSWLLPSTNENLQRLKTPASE